MPVQVPKKADAGGLIDCPGSVLQNLVCSTSCVLETDDELVLFGRGTDGALVNIGQQN